MSEFVDGLLFPNRAPARVKGLLGQHGALAAQLREARTLGTHLLDSTVHHLLTA